MPRVLARDRDSEGRMDFSDEFFESSPLWSHLGMRVASEEHGRCVLEIPCQPHLLNVYGKIHGGVIAVLIDSSINVAAMRECLMAGYGCVTPQMAVHYLQPAECGILRATARVVHRGNRLIVGESRVEDASGGLVAIGTATLVVRKADSNN